MWILESSGDILKGKRLWLKPGKSYLFGRVKKEGVVFILDHKTVSRKHFIIQVSDVVDGEVQKIFARTKCIVIDQNSKSGTTVNERLLRGKDLPALELDREENSVRPGTLDEILIIRWVPCVLAFHLLKKELKAGALQVRQERARRLGIKAVTDFLPDQTTHVVAAKRNTPPGLQGLITGKHIVTDAFLDALELAATPAALSQEESMSALEEDFDSAWPKEEEYLPPTAREPTTKPDEAYRPRTDRSNVFEDFIFVFGEQIQYELLLPVVTIGHGKALLFKVTAQTTVDDLVQYLQNSAGRKTFGRQGDDSSRGGVVLVRWRAPEDDSDRINDLIAQVSLKLDQRAIDQSEFLDAILSNNASQLRQTILQESFTEGLRAPPSSFAPGRGQTQIQSNGHAPATSQTEPSDTQRNSGPASSRRGPAQSQTQHAADTPEETPPTRSSRRTRGAPPTTVESPEVGPDDPPQSRSTRQTRASLPSPAPAASNVQEEQSSVRLSQTISENSPQQSGTSQGTTRRRFRAPLPVKKFDDDFNVDDIAPYEDSDEGDGSQVSMVVDSEDEDAAPEPTPAAPVVQQPTRKRQRSPEPEREDVMDDLLPAANAMKRQRREWDDEARRTGQPLFQSTQHVAVAKAPKKKELNIREAMRLQKEREKERAQRDGSESPPPSPYNDEDKGPSNLAVVEYVDLPVRKRVVRTGVNPEDDPRWNERWNGLKNFKKFRPQEKGHIRKSNHAGKVFVPMVAVPKKTGGLGDQYWDKPEEEVEYERRQKRKKEKRRAQESLSQSKSRETVQVSDDEDDRSGTPEDAGDDASQISPQTERLQEEAAAILDHEIDIDSPRRTRGDDARETQGTTSTRTQRTTFAATQTTHGSKRKAPASSNSTAASKKRQKTLPVTVVDDEDEGSDDDTKFKFGKGRTRRCR